MPNQEEHKVWRMLKRGCRDKIVKFKENIIPIFSAATVTDKYGTWTAGKSNCYSGQGWHVFDGNNSTCITQYRAYNDNDKAYATLTLPANVVISVEEIIIRCKDGGWDWRVFVEGYDEVNKKWVQITESTSTPDSAKDLTLPTTSTEFYNKFRVAIHKNASIGAIYKYGYVYGCQFTKGTLKVINGLA
jgi:hypothetical protein